MICASLASRLFLTEIKQIMKESILMEIRQIKLLLGLKKQVLTLEEFCAYAGISKNYAYRLTSTGKINFYRPFGKKIYFKLDEIIELLTTNVIQSEQGTTTKVFDYMLTHKI